MKAAVTSCHHWRVTPLHIGSFARTTAFGRIRACNKVSAIIKTAKAQKRVAQAGRTVRLITSKLPANVMGIAIPTMIESR